MKALLEDIFTRTSIKPADRIQIGWNDVYIADGFVNYEDLGIIQRNFSSVMEAGKAGRDKWPNGCFATIWMTPGKIATRGGISLSDDPDRSRRLSNIKELAQKEFNKQLH